MPVRLVYVSAPNSSSGGHVSSAALVTFAGATLFVAAAIGQRVTTSRLRSGLAVRQQEGVGSCHVGLILQEVREKVAFGAH